MLHPGSVLSTQPRAGQTAYPTPHPLGYQGSHRQVPQPTLRLLPPSSLPRACGQGPQRGHQRASPMGKMPRVLLGCCQGWGRSGDGEADGGMCVLRMRICERDTRKGTAQAAPWPVHPREVEEGHTGTPGGAAAGPDPAQSWGPTQTEPTACWEMGWGGHVARAGAPGALTSV